MKLHLQKSFLLLAFLFISQSLLADNETIRKAFKVAGFSALEIGSAFEVQVKQSSTFSLVATGHPEDVNALEVDINGNTLEVHFKENSNWFSWNWGKNRKKIVLQISMPKITSADFSGATKVEVRGFTDEENCNMTVSGASKLNLIDFNADKLSLEISGAGHVKLTGHIIKLNLDCSGASKLDAAETFIRDADLELSGASHALVQVQKTLRVNASGASKVSYKGSPNVSKDVSGASSVVRVND